MFRTLIPIFIGVSLLLPPPVSASSQLLVAVASNFLQPARAIAREYEKQSGTRIRISSGSTGKLYAQILHGARYDLFFAANSREPERLDKQGYVVDGSRFTYARGKLAAWSLDPAMLTDNPEAVLRSGKFNSVVLANPRTAPYGTAAVQVLTALKADTSQAQVLTAENVTQSFQYIAGGNAQLGFIAWSQLLSTGKQKTGSHWLVDEKYYQPIKQQAVWLKTSAGNAAAGKFLQFLRSKHGRELIKQFGYGVEG